jgi:hypothetical protein
MQILPHCPSSDLDVLIADLMFIRRVSDYVSAFRDLVDCHSASASSFVCLFALHTAEIARLP